MRPSLKISSNILNRLVAYDQHNAGYHFMGYLRLAEISVLARVSKSLRNDAQDGLTDIVERDLLKTLNEFAHDPDIIGKTVRFTYIWSYEATFPDQTILTKINQIENQTKRLNQLVESLKTPLEYYLRSILSSRFTLDNLPPKAIGLLLKSTVFVFKFNSTIMRLIKEIRALLNNWLFEVVNSNGRRRISPEVQITHFDQLIIRGADVNATESGSGWANRTILMHAVYYSDLHAVRILLRAGADVHRKDKDGNTALTHGYITTEIAQLLINAGINVNAGKTPALVRFLQYSSVSSERADTSVHMLLEAKADVNLTDEWGQTALMLAAGNGLVGVVDMLINSKADIEKIDNQGKTALMRPCLWFSTCNHEGYSKTVQRLLQARANVNIKNKYGETALSLAIKKLDDTLHGNEHDTRRTICKKITEELVNHGAEQPHPANCLVM